MYKIFVSREPGCCTITEIGVNWFTAIWVMSSGSVACMCVCGWVILVTGPCIGVGVAGVGVAGVGVAGVGVVGVGVAGVGVAGVGVAGVGVVGVGVAGVGVAGVGVAGVGEACCVTQ